MCMLESKCMNNIRTHLTYGSKILVVLFLGFVLTIGVPFSVEAKQNKILSAIADVVTPPTPPTPPATSPEPGPKNHAPVITTRSLPKGVVGKKYSATISATDRDGDAISLAISELPKGLALTDCKSSGLFSRSMTSCTVAGVPQSSFKGEVVVTAVDSRGATTKKSFDLVIR